MKKIAVAGIGGIGGNLGGYLARAGQDVTLICMSWRENAETIRRDGLTLISPRGDHHTVRPKVLFIDELHSCKEKFEILFISMSSNDTVSTLNIMRPYLAEDCWVISPQNGINEDLIIPITGSKNVIPCVSYTGGGFIRPGVVTMHPGSYMIGELDGQVSTRLKELSEILSAVVPVRISTDIMQERWRKLCVAAMVAPVSQIYGFNFGFLRSAFQNQKTRQVLAIFVSEVSRLAAAAGHALDTVEGIKVEDWQKYRNGQMPEIDQEIVKAGNHFPDKAPDPVARKAKSYQKSFSSEMDHINGYITRKGRELGFPTPVNDMIVSLVRDIEEGKIQPGPGNIDKVLESIEKEIRRERT